jgi:radical SAM protein with 4Fe4S-binding SPASM domain
MSEYRPYIVSWNLTKRCNLLCPHCYIDSSRLQTPGSELSRIDAQAVLGELFNLNPNMMLVLSGGEPMMREDIFSIVEGASSAGFIAVIGSNGTLLTEENIAILKKIGLKGLGVSIDSINPEYHDSFRGMKGAWELSVNALRCAKEAGIETQLDITLTDANYREIDGMIEFAIRLGAKAVNFFFLVCTGRAMKTDISTDNYDEAIRNIAKKSLNERRIMVRARCAPHIYRILYDDGFPIYEGARGCLAGRQYMRIDPQGNITPCPYMPLSIGNIKDKPLVELWEGSEYMKLLRSGSYSGRCGVCEYTDICGGCRARALVVNHDLMGEDTLCAYNPAGDKKISLKEAFKGSLEWTDEAKDRIKKVPFFMQGVVTRIIEAKAQERGVSLISSDLIDELKQNGHSIRKGRE